jgi:multidrug efflux pump subunit AcrA (membrane-fusion protein)
MNVPERYVPRSRRGSRPCFGSTPIPARFFSATITEVSPVLDQSSRTMAVKLTPTRQDPRVRAGMFARVKLITDVRTGTVKVPAAAVVKRFDEEYVFAVVAGEEGKTTVARARLSPASGSTTKSRSSRVSRPAKRLSSADRPSSRTRRRSTSCRASSRFPRRRA